MSEWAKQAPPGEGWKEIVKKYLSIEHCDNPGMGCPAAALAPDIARTRTAIRKRISGSMQEYRKRLLEFMPGRSSAEKQKNFVLIFTAMVGALTVARMISDREERESLLGMVRGHLLTSF